MRTCLVLFCACLFSVAGNAGEIVRWVDADGVVHFGDRHAAPSRGAQTVEVRPANGMDVAKAPTKAPTEAPNTAMAITRIDRAGPENKRGWRGYDARPKRRSPVRVRR